MGRRFIPHKSCRRGFNVLGRQLPGGDVLENICLGSSAVGYRTESLHGAGSPQAQRIMIARQGNMEAKKKLAKKIAGIKEE